MLRSIYGWCAHCTNHDTVTQLGLVECVSCLRRTIDPWAGMMPEPEGFIQDVDE